MLNNVRLSDTEPCHLPSAVYFKFRAARPIDIICILLVPAVFQLFSNPIPAIGENTIPERYQVHLLRNLPPLARSKSCHDVRPQEPVDDPALILIALQTGDAAGQEGDDRALAPEPEILLLDEPTSALDVSVQAEILNLLPDLRSERSLTYLMVTHDLAVVSHVCTDIAVMQLGKIVEMLNVDDIRAMRTSHPYTKHLLESSLGQRPEEVSA